MPYVQKEMVADSIRHSHADKANMAIRSRGHSPRGTAMHPTYIGSLMISARDLDPVKYTFPCR